MEIIVNMTRKHAIHRIAALTALTALCVGATRAEAQVPSFRELPSPVQFKDVVPLLDGAGAVDSVRMEIQANAKLVPQRRKVAIDGHEADVAAFAAEVMDGKRGAGRWFSLKFPLKPVSLQGRTVLVAELAAEKWAQGSWGPLGMCLLAKDGKRYGGHFYKDFANKGELFRQYQVRLEDKDGKLYAGDGSDIAAFQLSGNASQTLNTLYLKGVFAATPRQPSQRSLAARILTEPAKLKVYPNGTKVEAEVKGGAGESLPEDALVWSLNDYLDSPVADGHAPFGPAEWRNGVKLSLDGAKFPAGFYYLRLSLASDGATVPWNGSRPAGFLAFGWLPAIQPLPLVFADQSRFGCGGTNFLGSDRNPFAPLYPAMGFRWVGMFSKLALLDVPGKPFVPKNDQQLASYVNSPERQGDLAYFYECYSVPARLLKLPDFVSPASVVKDPARVGQAYGLKDPAGYQELFATVADQARRRREIVDTQLSRNYYVPHWEPDWHFHGTEDEFLEYYATARKALDQSDPTGVLLGAKYGVMEVGYAKLERLFAKGLGKYLGGVITHVYTMKGAASPEEEGLDLECRRLRQLMDRYLPPGSPLINAEGGTRYACFRQAANPQFMKDHLGRALRRHLIVLGEGFDCTYFFYSADGHPDSSQLDSVSGEPGYGLFFNEDPEGRDYGAHDVSPKPFAMGAAAATRLLEGTKTLGRLDYFGPEVYAYSFERGDQLMMVLWAPFHPVSVDLETCAPEVTVYDVMGNPGIMKANGGRVKLQLDGAPTYVLGLGSEAVANTRGKTVLKGICGRKASPVFMPGPDDKVTVERAGKTWPLDEGLTIPENLSTGVHLLAERGKDGRLLNSRLLDLVGAGLLERIADDKDGFHATCLNQAGKPRDFELVGEFRGATRFRETVSLAPGERKTVDVPLAALRYDPVEGVGAWTLSLRDAVDSSTHSQLSHVWGGAGPEQYGKFDEFRGQEAINYHAADWKGMDDFSVRQRLVVEGDALRLVVEVKDDVAWKKPYPDALWRTDMLVIAVGSGPERDNEWQRKRIFGVRLAEDGKSLVGEMIGSPPRLFTPCGELSGTVRRDEAAKLTTYELTIPFKVVGAPEAIRRDGRLGLGLSVMDIDVPGEAEKDAHRQLSLYGGAPFFMQSMKFGTIYVE